MCTFTIRRQRRGAKRPHYRSPAAVTQRSMSPGDPLAIDLARLAAGLPDSGAARLERIRGLAAGIGRTSVCACSRLALEDGMAILMVAAEPAASAMPLAERVRRTFADAEGAIAVFSPAGALIHASAEAAAQLGPMTTLAAWGAGALAAEALNCGRASGNSLIGPVEFQRIGTGGNAVVLAILAAEPDRSQPPSSEIGMDEVPFPIEPAQAEQRAVPADGAEPAAVPPRPERPLPSVP